MEKLVCIVIQIFGIIINHSFGQNQGNFYKYTNLFIFIKVVGLCLL